MDQVSNGRDYEQQLTHLFNLFNKRFWDNELPEVIITFVPTRGAHGHVTSEPVWVSDKESKYELNISALTINRSPEDICETILHEQCHLYNLMHGIKDCSNMGRYHNVRFKETALAHGLDVKHHDRYGWAITMLNTESLAYLKRLNLKKFEFRRSTAGAKKHTLVRYACPKCGKDGPFCYVSSHQTLICGKCKKNYLVYSPSEKEH